jgi:hypothetical protein
MRTLVAVLSDSRGRELITHIKSTLPRNIITKGFSIPGGRIGKLLLHAKRTIKRFRRDFPAPNKIVLVIAGGLCDLTAKNHSSGEISYPTTENKADRLIENLQAVKRYCAREGIKLILSTIIPADIPEANRIRAEQGIIKNPSFCYEELQFQQSILEKDIDKVNESILQSGYNGEHRTVNIYHNFTKHCNYDTVNGRRVKRPRDNPDFRRLCDGVHFVEKLQEIFHKKIATALRYSCEIATDFNNNPNPTGESNIEVTIF